MSGNNLKEGSHTTPLDAKIADWEVILPHQRTRLVRYCSRLTGDPDAAEDLTQETLYEAWRHLDRLYEPAGLDHWLAAIARNVYLRWARRREREPLRAAPSIATDDDAPSAPEDLLVDDFDLEVELERAELVELLDRAMALLPEETRQVLVQRYVEESPQAEIARRLGVREGAVEARLQRGKLAMRRLLATTFVREVAPYGFVDETTAAWQETRLWCPGCARHHLQGYLRSEQGELRMRCPGCSADGYGDYLNATVGDALQGVHTYKPAISRCLQIIHNLYQVRAVNGARLCPTCHTWRPIRRGLLCRGAADWVHQESISIACPTCGTDDRETWHALTWSLPEARRFWREHPRMRFLSGSEVEVDGSPAVVTGFESLTDGARLEAVLLRATGKVLSVHGMTRRGQEA